MSRKLTPRQAVARSYPGWDYDMADRLIAWLDDCGYRITEKDSAHPDASLVPSVPEHQDDAELAAAH